MSQNSIFISSPTNNPATLFLKTSIHLLLLDTAPILMFGEWILSNRAIMSKAKKIKLLFCEIFQQGLLFPLYCYVHTTRILLTEVNKCTLPIYINMCLPSITTTTVPTSEQDVEIMKLTHTNFCGRKWTWLNKSIKKVLSFNLLGGGEIWNLVTCRNPKISKIEKLQK